MGRFIKIRVVVEIPRSTIEHTEFNPIKDDRMNMPIGPTKRTKTAPPL